MAGGLDWALASYLAWFSTLILCCHMPVALYLRYTFFLLFALLSVIPWARPAYSMGQTGLPALDGDKLEQTCA
eukprot:1175588-Prorocentrum_minimum.AAC.3